MKGDSSSWWAKTLDMKIAEAGLIKTPRKGQGKPAEGCTTKQIQHI